MLLLVLQGDKVITGHFIIVFNIHTDFGNVIKLDLKFNHLNFDIQMDQVARILLVTPSFSEIFIANLVIL